MNWLSILRFEFSYRRNRPATYLFFVLLLGMSFATVSTDMIQGLTGGAVKDNATLVVARISLFLFLFMGVLISSAIMGVSVVRDFEHCTDALFFTNPIRKWEFLAGRYGGAMLILLMTLMAIPLGLLLGEAAPWRNADRLLPFRAAAYWQPYWQPYWTIIVPNALIVGSIFFAVGALSRKMLVVFTQGMVFLMLYLVSGTLLSQIDRREIAALLDPFGLRAIGYVTQYWSISQQNNQLLSLTDTLLVNRLLWLGIAGVTLAATYVFFSYEYTPSLFGQKRKAEKQAELSVTAARRPLPRVKRDYGAWNWVSDLGHLTVFYTKVVMKDLPFLALSLGGLGMFLFSAVDNAGGWYGSRTLPTTYVMLTKMSVFTGLFLFILMVLYVGDLIWKERDVRISLISDALPVPNWVPLLSKYLGLGLAFALVITLAIGLGALLFAGAVVLSVRGSEELLKLRLKIGRHQLTRPVLTFGLAMLIVFISSGSYIYYNTNVLNRYQNSKADEAQQADYEKTLKRFASLPQPRITAIRVNVDLFPETRDFTATGWYILKNKTTQPIRYIHLQSYSDDDMQVKQLKLSVPSQLDNLYVADYAYRMYHLDQPLQPGDSLRLDFDLLYRTKGFKNGNTNIDIVQNGTFFTNQYFPGIGYSEQYELSSDDKRKDNGLKPKERMRAQKDPAGVRQNVFGDDADQIRFAMTISTTPDQTAIAPGYLQKEWLKTGPDGKQRRYFSYQMDSPIADFYSIVSARYLVKKEVYTGKAGNPISLEIYYHPGHTHNLGRMMRGMKASLAYYQANYGAFQHRQLRIMEFPRYRSYAQSFANTIPFGEDMGFVADIDDKQDIDMPFFVTAHETAHQWWGHQVTEANIRGSAMLSESLAEYSALMVMKHQYPQERMQEFLRYELDYYLRGRQSETKKEQPLSQCEGQSYIHYNKGAHVLYALQDQIGEDKLNQALRTYRDRWNVARVAQTGIYLTAADLTSELQAVTPDSLRGLLDDWVNAITLYELKTDKVTVTSVGKQYDVQLTISAEKVRADSLGNETKRPINEWIWIGVYAPKTKGSDSEKLLYYQRHHITKPKQFITVRVNQKPDRAGIDPMNLLIDRHPKDNVKAIEMP